MSGWGTNGNANRIKNTYIKGFLDISGGSLIVEKTSTLQIMAHDRDEPVLEFKPEYFTVNTTGSYDVSYSALAALAVLGVSFEQSTVATFERIKYITTGKSGLPPNEVLFTDIGNDDEHPELRVYGLIKGHYGLDVDGDVSFNNNFFVSGDSSFNSNLSIGNNLSLNGNLYVGKSSLFIGDVSLNGNVKMGSGSNSISVNKDISAGYAFDVSGLTIFRNTMYVASDVSLGAKLFVNGDVSLNKSLLVGQDVSLNGNLYVGKSSLFIGDVSLNGNVKMGSGSNFVVINKDISAGYAFDVSGLTIFRNTMYVASDVSFGAKFFVNGDVSLNKSLLVGQDVSLNGNLYVGKSSLFIGDVSLNGNVKMGSGSKSISVNKDISAGYAFDVSGLTIFRNTMYVASDVSFGAKFFVNGDVSLNKNLLVGQDISLNGNLYVGKSSLFIGDVSLNGNVKMGSGSNFVVINKDISAGYAFDVSGLTIFRNTMYVASDVSLGAKFFVNGDVSLNKNLLVGQDVSLNGNLYVGKSSLFIGDVSLNGNVKMGSGSNSVVINKDISAGYAFDVSGLTIFRNTVYVVSDASLGVGFFVNGDISLNRNLSVGGDLSLNGNVKMGFGSNSVVINKDISAGYAFDVSGRSQVRGNLDVAGVFTVNGAPISAGGSLTGNVQVGSNSGFVSIDKPQFYADPSLTIYYNFDTSINGGTGVQNIAKPGTYDGSLNIGGANTGLMIDSIIKKYGASSFKNNPTSTNLGITICNNSIPTSFEVGSTMSFSFWVYKTTLPGSTTFDRIFEFSDLTTGSIDNNTIALDINSSGVVLPVLTFGGTASSCITVISSPILTYNVCNANWNHIVWSITPTNSYIYINGSLTQIDIVNNPVPTTPRKSAFLGYSLNNQGTRDFLGNIDDFRYYKDKALNYAEIYQLYNNNFYTFDICGGFLANGSSVIYEPVGSVATANRGTLTLLHGDASGSSSIMFKSVNDPLEYAYIEYDENVTGSTGYNYGLLTIGIENDAGGGAYTAQADRISLFPSGGTGFVGVNTKIPQYSLDVSGSFNTNADASINGVSVGRGTGNVATNTVLGYNALYSNTTGFSNIAVGWNALYSNNGGHNNIAVGASALTSNNGGHNNIAVGANALTSNNGGDSNIAVGNAALYSNTDGSSNTAVGTNSLTLNIAGSNNTAVGFGAIAIINNNNNTAIGYKAGNNSTNVGDNNTFLGASTSMSGIFTNSTAVGYNAQITGSNIVQLGSSCTAQATSFNATSDYREKDNVMELDESFTVDTLRPVVYDFKPLGKKHIGFIAHEVQEFYPFLVSGEKDGLNSQSLNYNGFIGILTKEIQVLKKKVADQEAKALEQEANALEQSVKTLDQDARIQALEQSVKTLEKFILNK